jgi:hypothetical protein
VAALPPSTPPVSSIDQALAQMRAVDAALPASDGVACFNRMYIAVTDAVRQRVTAGYFADSAFVSHLDVVFANQYFAAVDALAVGGDLPKAWQPLVSARSSPGIEPIQFALAGMNSHINHDLPIALNRASMDLGTQLDQGTHHSDYQKVDELLNTAEQSVRQSFESGVVLDADRHAQAVLDLVCNWSIASARDVAWNTALVLSSLGFDSVPGRLLAGSLARSVAMASRLLLVAV